MDVRSGYCFSEGFVQHSRNASCFCRMGCLPTDGMKATPRASPDCVYQNALELIEEISAIEYQIVHLEQYLLHLYRTVLNQHLTSCPASVQLLKFDSSCHMEPQLKNDRKMMENSRKFTDIRTYSGNDTLYADKRDRYTGNGYSGEVVDYDSNGYKNGHTHMRASSDITYFSKANSKKETGTTTCNRTLADHLCVSLQENVLETPCKLSEDIIKCIAAVFCTLNDAKVSETASSSPFSSLSSTSNFSLQERSDVRSPRFSYENVQSSLKERDNSFPVMIEISRISIDKDRFKSAALLLEGHRKLIRHLETVDPSKLGHEEKLAFWVNIHNAMVMHAFIAYGLQNNQIRSTPLILKKSYNVGGRNFNACEIKNSILGCSLRLKSSRLSFSSSMKLTSISNQHPYALEHPEPLVHFALSVGAYSDPPVRAYTAKNIKEQLKVAKEEYIQANVFLQRDRITLPKILEFYAQDASLDLSSLLDVVRNSLPRDNQRYIQECVKGKLEKHTHWSSYRSTFRYVLHRGLILSV